MLERAERADALVLGPGLGREPGARRVRARPSRAPRRVPLLLDADGLNAHAGSARRRSPTREAPTVLTPHAGELARLLETDSAAVGAHRLRQRPRGRARRRGRSSCSRAMTRSSPTPDGRVAVSRGGAPALATAGTGDVLSGVIGAFLAKRMDPFARRLRRRARPRPRRASWRAREIGPEGVIAGDVIAALPRALAAPGY